MSDEYEVEMLFSFRHPRHGMYWVWYDPNMQTYGISQSAAAPWCAYASLEALFKQKGL